MESRAIYTTLNRRMTLRTQTNQIAQVISHKPIILELAPGYLVMHVEWSTKLLLSYAAFLASIVISLAGKVFLSIPIWASPFVMSTLPVRMIFASIPGIKAVKRTKHIIQYVTTLLYRKVAATNTKFFTATMTGKSQPSMSRFASHRAELSVTMLITMTVYSKWLLAILTNDLYRCLGHLSAFIRAVTVLPIVIKKRLAACLASEVFCILFSSVLPKAFTRAEFLRGTARNITRAAIDAGSWCFVHESIIAQEGE